MRRATHVANPVTKVHQQSSPDSTWRVTFDGALPFQGYARSVTSVVATGNLKNGSNVIRYTAPNVLTSRGAGKDQVELKWGEALSGAVTITARID
jgi:hypothetical protein